MGIDVTELASPADAGFAAFAEVYRNDVLARDPDDPPLSNEHIGRDVFVVSPDHLNRVFAATVDDRPAGFAVIMAQAENRSEINPAEVEIAVAPAERRNGVASALAERVVTAVREMGKNSILGYASLDLWSEEGLGFCSAFGLTKRQEERCSRTIVADIDRSLLDGWIADAASKADRYRIEQWEGACPDHLVKAWCGAAAAMEDAPLDDVDFDPHTRDVEAQRAADETTARKGFRVYRTLALGPDDEPAAMTDLYVSDERPEVGHQGDTGVLAAHRGHGLGKWLKAANFYQVVAAHPELRVIETYNAQSNPWMLDINIAMGFRPHHLYMAYQAPLETVAERISRGS